jgi:hypothetical protein
VADAAIAWTDAVKVAGRQPLALAVGDDATLAQIFGYAPGLEAAGYTVLGASASDEPAVTSSRVAAGVQRVYFRLAAVPRRSESLDRARVTACRRQFERKRLHHRARPLSNPFLSFQYDHVFSDLLPRVARAHADLSHAIDELEPAIVLVGTHGFISHAAAVAARARGVRSVFLQHGGALTWLHGSSADQVWAWGTLPATIFRESYGWPEARVTVVGAPQLTPARRRADDAANRGDVRRRFDVPVDGHMLLVITSGNSGCDRRPATPSADGYVHVV